MATVRYTVLDGEVIAEKRDGARKEYVPDPLGSTAALLDSTQSATDTFSYWPYGDEQARTGATATPFRYVGTLGYYRDSAAREYVRARYLNTSQGRWMTEDPIGFYGGIDLYQYVESAPTSSIDPTGFAKMMFVPSAESPSIPSHVYLFFEHGPCMGHYAWGFAGPVHENDNYVWYSDPRNPRVPSPYDPAGHKWIDEVTEHGKPIRRDTNRTFEKNLCDCIRKSKPNPPAYVFPFYVCGTWANQMWDCAKGGGPNALPPPADVPPWRPPSSGNHAFQR